MKVKDLFKFGGTSDFGKLTPIISLIGVVLILALWWVIAEFNIISDKVLPGPIEVLSAFPKLFTENSLLGNMWYSIRMNLMAYVCAILISLPLGFLIATIPFLNLVIGKYINAVRFLPLPAITGIFVALLGLTFNMKVQFLACGLVIFMLPAIANKVNELQNPAGKDYIYLQTIKTLGATGWQKFKYVYFPFVTSGVFPEIRSLAAISWSYVTISELIYKDGAVSGLGALINTMIRQSNMAGAWAGLFLIIIIGVLQDFAFKKLEEVLFPHRFNKKRLF